MKQSEKNQGFHLLDLMVVLALLVLVLTMGIERLDRYAELNRLQSGARILVSELNRARNLALSHNLSVRFELCPEPATYALATGQDPLVWKVLPERVSLIQIPKRVIQFHSRGTAAPAGSIVIENRSGRIRVVVNPSGRIRKEEQFFE